MTRLLQEDLDYSFIGIIHALAEITDRSTVVLIDYLYHKTYNSRAVTWERFRTPRRHVNEYFYTDNKNASSNATVIRDHHSSPTDN